MQFGVSPKQVLNTGRNALQWLQLSANALLHLESGDTRDLEGQVQVP